MVWLGPLLRVSPAEAEVSAGLCSHLELGFSSRLPGCCQNSTSCGCRTDVPSFLLAASQEEVSDPESSCK